MNEIQSTILNIFKEVADVCKELGLRYFAIGGTAIGAVRHGGFIPWDDDLDIAMPVQDYARFLSEAQSYLPEYLEIRTFEEMEHNQNVFAKVVDLRTTNIEPVEIGYPDSYKGVYVDVMPMSGIPAGASQRLFTGKVALYGALAYGLPWRIGDRSTLKHKVAYFATLPFRPFLDVRSVLRRWSDLLASYPYGSTEYVGYTWWPKVSRLVFPYEWFETSVSMPFEDTTICMPCGYDEYLTKQFGDYMQLPPESQRITHNGFIDLEHSYKDYRDGRITIPINCSDDAIQHSGR